MLVNIYYTEWQLAVSIVHKLTEFIDLYEATFDLMENTSNCYKGFLQFFTTFKIDFERKLNKESWTNGKPWVSVSPKCTDCY